METPFSHLAGYDIDAALKQLCKRAHNLRALALPKDYEHTKEYYDHRLILLTAWYSAMIPFLAKPNQEATTDYSIFATMVQLIRYQMPTYFVDANLCDALMHTEAPGELTFNEIRWPMPAMVFMLPRIFSDRYFGAPVPYIMVANFPESIKDAQHPIMVDGMKSKPVHITCTHDTFLCTMMKWENRIPVHYDARSPMHLPVKELLDGGLKAYKSNPDIDVAEDKEAEVRIINRMTNLGVNILLAMTAENDLVTREKIIRPVRKQGNTIVRRALWKPNFIGKGFRIEYESAAPEGSHRSPHAHWRKGHWRMQRHGPRNTLTKRIWIFPVFVGLKK